jgi:hypothetical protein
VTQREQFLFILYVYVYSKIRTFFTVMIYGNFNPEMKFEVTFRWNYQDEDYTFVDT